MSEPQGKIIDGEFQLVNGDGLPVVRALPPALPSPRQLTAQAKADLAFATTKLLAGEIYNVRVWLRACAERNPAEAIRLFMELSEFVTPRLKAANVNLSAHADANAPRRLTDMSMEELDGLIGN